MAATLIRQGATVPLALQLPDGEIGKFLQAEVHNSAGVLLATRDLTHVASGSYTDFAYAMPDESILVVTYVVYNEVGHTTESDDHLRAQDVFVRDLSAQPGDEMDLEADAVDATAVATDAIDADALAADAVAKIVAAFNDLSIVDVQTALTNQGYTSARAPYLDELSAANLPTDVAVIQADVVAIQADTDDIQTRLPAALIGGRMDSDVGNMQAGVIDAAAIATDAVDADALAADAVAEIQVGLATSLAVAALQLDTDDIQTRLPAALIGGRMDSDVAVIQAAALAAINTYLAVTAAHGVGAWDAVGGGLTQQQARDAMKLAPTGGAPAAGSVDLHLDNIEDDTNEAQGKLPANNIADETLQQAAHVQTQTDISNLENLSQVQAQAASNAALLALGYTLARADKLDFLDALISSRVTPAQITAAVASIMGSDSRDLTELAGAGWEAATDTLEQIRDSIGSGGISQQQVRDAMKLTPSAGVPAAGSVDLHLDTIEDDTAALEQRLTVARAAALDEITAARLGELDPANLPQDVADVLTAVGALEDITITDVQTALTNQGYTTTRADFIELVKKMLINRLELVDGNPGVWTLYDDDDVTPLLTFQIRDKTGGLLFQQPGGPAWRTHGV